MQDESTKQVNQLFAAVMAMETEQAFQYLSEVDMAADVVNRVAVLLKPSETRATFLENRGLADMLINEVSAEQDLSGQSIANIKFLKKIGQGGMGAVYQGEDMVLERIVAVKTLLHKHPDKSQAHDRFRREALLLSKLDHPNICRIYSLIQTGQTDFLVLEYIQGETLDQNSFKTLSKTKQLDVITQILQGLQAAHRQNIIHRDIKPGNIMTTQEGEIKVLDFGISRLSDDAGINNEAQTGSQYKNQTVVGSVMGTLNFMSPEQAAGEELTTASDMYSFGLLLQTLLSNVAPYPNNTTAEQLHELSNRGETQVPKDLPHHWLKLIQALKSLAPVDRPTAKEALHEINKIKAKPAKRLRLTGVVLLLLLGAVATGKYITDLKHERTQAQLAQQRAEQLVDFMANMFQNANPYDAEGKEITAVELLDQGVERIDEELSEQPDTRVYLKAVMADSYRLLGQLNKAKVLLDDAKQIISTQNDINQKSRFKTTESEIQYHIEVDSYDHANELLTELLLNPDTIELKKRIDLQSTQAFLNIRLGHCEKSVRISEQMLADIASAKQTMDEETINAYNIQGMCFYQSGEYQKAIDSFKLGREVISQSKQDFKSLDISFVNNLSIAYSGLMNDELALEMAFEHKDLQEAFLPENHLDLALSYSSIAVNYINMNDFENAKPWNQKAVDLHAFNYQAGTVDEGQNLYSYAMVLFQKAAILKSEEAYRQAINIHREAREKLQKILPEDHELIANSYALTAQFEWLEGGVSSEADQTLELAFAMFERLQQPLVRRHLDAHELKIVMLKETDMAAAKQKFDALIQQLQADGDKQTEIKYLQENHPDLLQK